MDLSGATWRKASYSNDSGANCVEVAAVWRKASHSSSEGDDCVEVSAVPGIVALRDSKAPESGVLLLDHEGARALSAQVKAL